MTGTMGNQDPLLLNTQQAMATGSVSGAQTGPVTDKIAQAIAMGAIARPSTPLGWKALVDQFTESASDRQAVAPVQANVVSATIAPKTMTATNATKGTPAAAAAPGAPAQPGAGAGGGDLQSFLYGEKMAESSGNYTVGEGGAYGMIEPYWQSTARDAGYGQYANQPAGNAPPAVQDAVASWLATQNFNKYGSWAHAAQAWYNPATVGQDGYTPPGNVLTMGQYSQRVLNFMGQAPGGGGAPAAAAAPGDTKPGNLGSSTAIDYARKQLGTPYVWGGEQEGVGFDCSGLVQAAFAHAGVQLPRVAQDQYNATTKVPQGQEQPGDLMFFGTGTGDITHVGIYLGNGQMIDAPNSGSVVRTENSGWGDYVGATRPTDATGASTLPAKAAPNVNPGPSQAALQAAYYEAYTHVQSALTMKGAA